VRHVGGDGNGDATGAFDLFDEFIESVLTARGDDDARARFAECQSGRASDARCPTRRPSRRRPVHPEV